MRTVKILIILVLLFPAGSAAAPAPSTGGTTNWLDTFDEWVGPRDMSMYNPPIETPERASITEEVARQYPGMILLDENVTLTFPEIPSATVSGQPSGPAVDVVMTDPVYFSPVPTAGGANLTSLPPLRKYDLVTADPAAFVADAGSGGPVTLRLPGGEFVLDLEPVPGPVAEGTRAFVKNESGTFEVALPSTWRFEGTVAGKPGSLTSFTVGSDVILGTVRCGSTSLVIGQAGTVEVGGEQKVVHIIYDERDVIPKFWPLATDVCVTPSGTGGSPEVTGARVATLVKSLMDAVAFGSCRGGKPDELDPAFGRTGESDPDPGRISLERAKQIASDYIEERDTGQDLALVTARYVVPHADGLPGEYLIRYSRIIGGVRCLSDGITVTVHPATGCVMSYYKSWTMPEGQVPTDAGAKISESEAGAIVADVMTENGAGGVQILSSEKQWVDLNYPAGLQEPHDIRLAWHVRFTDDYYRSRGVTFPAAVWVDAETGEVFRCLYSLD
jgi:hypothetical protein